MKKGRVLLCLFVALMVIFISLAGCKAAEPEKIQINEVTHSVFYSPLYAAMGMGFFEEQGLTIELTNGGGSDKSMTAVLSGQADIGLMGPETAVYVYNQGKEDHAVVIGQLTKRDGSFLISRKEEKDFSWESLKDKTVIGGRKGGMPEMCLEHVLKSKGLVPGKDVNVDTNVQFNLMAGAFEGGQGDYVTMFEPTASSFVKEGKGYIVASVGEVAGEVPFTAFIVKKSYVDSNKDKLQRFMKAVYKGQKWVQESKPEDIAKVIKPYFPDTDEDLLATVAKRYKDVDAWMSDPIMKEESFMLMQEIMTEAGELDKQAPYDKLVDNTFAGNAMK